MDFKKIVKIITSRAIFLFIGICLAISTSYVLAVINTPSVSDGTPLTVSLWGTLKADLEMLDAKSLSCHTVTSPLTAYSHGVTGGVTCDYGILTGGGCKFNVNEGHRQVTANHPSGNGWRCTSEGPAQSGLYAAAICCEFN